MADETDGAPVLPLDDRTEWLDVPRRKIVPFLLERVPEFCVLSELRRAGWNNPKGDAFFKRQRNTADTSDAKTEAYFYKLMSNIAKELHRRSYVFTLPPRDDGTAPQILDMSMAPGAFLGAALDRNPTAEALAFSLPFADGGHRVLLDPSPRVARRFLDITMLATDMGYPTIPPDHADAGRFVARQFAPDRLFDLALCDGQVLRTQTRAAYREAREARRLTLVQLALSLEYLRPGGTMLVLLHKAEGWETINLLRTFVQFASVRLCKPTVGHAKRSSFYMVASRIESQHPAALQAIARWKRHWAVATFGSDEDMRALYMERELSVDAVLEQFGDELIRLARDVWKTQADALADAPWMKGKKHKGPE